MCSQSHQRGGEWIQLCKCFYYLVRGKRAAIKEAAFCTVPVPAGRESRIICQIRAFSRPHLQYKWNNICFSIIWRPVFICVCSRAALWSRARFCRCQGNANVCVSLVGTLSLFHFVHLVLFQRHYSAFVVMSKWLSMQTAFHERIIQTWLLSKRKRNLPLFQNSFFDFRLVSQQRRLIIFGRCTKRDAKHASKSQNRVGMQNPPSHVSGTTERRLVDNKTLSSSIEGQIQSRFVLFASYICV